MVEIDPGDGHQSGEEDQSGHQPGTRAEAQVGQREQHGADDHDHAAGRGVEVVAEERAHHRRADA